MNSPLVNDVVYARDGERASGKTLSFPTDKVMKWAGPSRELIFGQSATTALIASTDRIARSEATVLITGETGTGKEVIARYIHEHSGRKGPFIAVNCAALNESLIEAELFGHESGAFTGASQSRTGWFEAAAAGTLFLDEIGDLPLAMQVKLLRVLQERQIVKIGSRRSLPVDFRLLAATNVDLQEAVQLGRFRADLYYRLAVATVSTTALRERKTDILPLARHFASVYGAKLQQYDVDFSESAQQLLLAHSWPGNIRELENAVHHALLMCDNDIIEARDLKLLKQPNFNGASSAHAGLGGTLAEALRMQLMTYFDDKHPELYTNFNRTLIQTAFEYCGENQVRTAQLLGISRNILRTQLKHFGLL